MSTQDHTCAGCGAPLAADQRYCLACGRPCSPVRLAFLDVLQGELPAAPTTILGAPAAGYAPPPEPPGTLAALRRYSGLFGLLGVLLAALLIGLLVGHWLTGGASTPAKQVLEVKGLPAVAAAPAASSGAANASGSTGASSSSGGGSSAGGHSSSGSGSSHAHAAASSEGGVQESSAEEAQSAREAQTTKALPAAKKVSTKTAHTTGRQHAEELKEQGAAPLVTP